jgi:hypothetical protein
MSLFTSISEGAINPADEDVRQLADREEQYIRAVMRIGTVQDPVRELAAEILQWGRAQGISVDIDLPHGSALESDVTDLREMLERAYPLSAGAASARLSAREEGSSIVVRLVISGCDDCEIASVRIGSATMVCLGEGDLMVEARYVR